MDTVTLEAVKGKIKQAATLLAEAAVEYCKAEDPGQTDQQYYDMISVELMARRPQPTEAAKRWAAENNSSWIPEVAPEEAPTCSLFITTGHPMTNTVQKLLDCLLGPSPKLRQDIPLDSFVGEHCRLVISQAAVLMHLLDPALHESLRKVVKENCDILIVG